MTFILRTLGLGLLAKSNYEAFFSGHGGRQFPVVHSAAFWEPKLAKGFLSGLKTVQIEAQTKVLIHMILRLASHERMVLQLKPDPQFTPLMNSYLILTTFGVDGPPVGALLPFEPWEAVEMGLICSWFDLSTQTYVDQESLATKLQCQYRQLRTLLPIACAKVDLVRTTHKLFPATSNSTKCVGEGLWSICYMMFHEEQARIVINKYVKSTAGKRPNLNSYSGVLQERLPILRKYRYRIPCLFVTLYLEVVDNRSGPASELFAWGLNEFGALFKNILMELFLEQEIPPEEMCLVLAALLALSDTFFLGMNSTKSRRGTLPMRLPYQRPPMADFLTWIEEPLDLHYGWDVIETLICSFQAVFATDKHGGTDSVLFKLLNHIKPAVVGSPVPEPY